MKTQQKYALNLTDNHMYTIMLEQIADFYQITMGKTLIIGDNIMSKDFTFMVDKHKTKSRGMIEALKKEYDQEPTKVKELVGILERLRTTLGE